MRDLRQFLSEHRSTVWTLPPRMGARHDITALQQFTEQVQRSEAHLFAPRPATRWLSMQPQGTGGPFGFNGQNPTRDAMIDYYLGAAVTGNVTLEIADVTGERKRTFTRPAQQGITRVCWNFTFDNVPDPNAGARGAGGGGGGGEVESSSCPMSTPVPLGRGVPSRSAGGAFVVVPRSTAALPDLRW